MDGDGYPTNEELERIRTWPYQDCAGLLRFAGEMFTSSGYGRFVQSGNEFRLITGGWSGNEEVCEALQENKMFWVLCWKSTHRGGLDVFDVPEINMGQSQSSASVSALDRHSLCCNAPIFFVYEGGPVCTKCNNWTVTNEGATEFLAEDLEGEDQKLVK